MELYEILPYFIGTSGIAALIFAALRFNRADAGENVKQAREVMASMRELINELEGQLERTRNERDNCYTERDLLRERLSHE